MKVAIAFFALVALAVAAPATPDSEAQILKHTQGINQVDGYNFAIETSNGISQSEKGTLINAGSEDATIAVRGSFQYTGPDGVSYEVSYVADENGFRPSGEHLPLAFGEQFTFP